MSFAVLSSQAPMNRFEGGFSGARWTVGHLAHAPVFLFDTAVSSSITAPSNNVSALADARPTGTKTLTGSGAARPVLHPEITLDGRPAIVYTNAAASKLTTDAGSGALGNTPFALFLIAEYTSAPDYAPAMTLGGSQTGGPFPENANLGTLANGGTTYDWIGYYAQNPTSGAFKIGYNGSEGRLAVNTAGPSSYLLVSDGTRTKFLRDGRTVAVVDGLTWITKSAELELGGASVTGFGVTMDHRQYYGFFLYNAGGSMTEVEIRALLASTFSLSPSLPHPRRAIVHGTSIDRDYPNGSPATAWLAIAADLADDEWEVTNYSVVGMGAGKLPNSNGTNLYGVGGSVTAPTAGLGSVAASQWSSIWDISPQNTDNIYFSGTLSENDIYFRASAAQCFGYLQVIGALVIASGGKYAVCTPAARAGTGTPSVFVTGATNATPIEITCNLAHGLTTGATVGIRDVLGNTAANGSWTVTVTSSTKFTLDTSVGNGAYTADSGVGYWSGNVNAYEAERQALLALIAAHWEGNLSAVLVKSASNASPIAVTTELPHGLATGAAVSLAQVLGNTAANGVGQTITVTGPSSFTIDGSTGNGAYTGAGVVYWGTGLGGSFYVNFAAEAPFNNPDDDFWFEDDKDHWRAPLQEFAGLIAAQAAFGVTG